MAETWFIWIMLYSVIGWIYETILCSVTQKRFVNRGFLNGPYCPIYGCGAALDIFFLSGIRNPLLLILAGAALASSLEYLTSWGISYSLLCNWFRNAVLPADNELLADVMRERSGKRCAVCGKPVYSSSNRAKYCPACAKQERRKQDAKRKREQYWNLRR